MDFFKYIHAVGTGPKGNRDLTFEESQDMMRQILEQSVYPEQISAFLLGWRLKPETNEEFRGALSACDEYIQAFEIENSIELGYPFDGKAKNPYIFPLVAKVLKDSNLNVVVIGDELQPAKNGITTKEICNNIQLSKNCHFFDRKDFFPKLHQLSELRMKLGLRTGLSTYVKKYVEIFSDRYKRLALLQGNEGTPELFSKGRLWVTNGGDIEEIIINPEYYGINYKKSWETISLQESLAQLNSPSDEYMKLAKLNAAIYLFVSQKAKSIDEAFEKLNG